MSGEREVIVWSAGRGGRITLTRVPQPTRSPSRPGPPEPVPWRVWSTDRNPSDAAVFVETEALDAAVAWMAPRTPPLATVLCVERAGVDPAGSKVQLFEVSSGIAGNWLVREVWAG
jgi:hypothetical protein